MQDIKKVSVTKVASIEIFLETYVEIPQSSVFLMKG